MLVWGDYVWIPFVFSIQAWVLLDVCITEHSQSSLPFVSFLPYELHELTGLDWMIRC
jgi:hypothetical protein